MILENLSREELMEAALLAIEGITYFDPVDMPYINTDSTLEKEVDKIRDNFERQKCKLDQIYFISHVATGKKRCCQKNGELRACGSSGIEALKSAINATKDANIIDVEKILAEEYIPSKEFPYTNILPAKEKNAESKN